MSKNFRLEIVTPEKTIFDGTVTSLTLPAVDGQLGVLAGHAPLVTAIDIGAVDVVLENGERMEMFVSDGFFEVADNEARLLADVGESLADIDLDDAKKEEDEARAALADQPVGPVNAERLRIERQLQRALWRQRLRSKSNS